MAIHANFQQVEEKPASVQLEAFNCTSEKSLHEAFTLFTEMSEQLTTSYSLLEGRVVDLNRELSDETALRLNELAEKEKLATRLETLLNVLPGGVVVLDAKGLVRECNPAALDFLDEPVVGELWRNVINRCFAPKKDDGHEVSLHDGRRISIATRNLEDDGQIVLLTDQTETRRLQGELSRHERLSALGKMVSALAHQIRTPLSAAMLYAGHLSNESISSEKRHKFCEKIKNRLHHMERQVQDMLFYVKGELALNDEVTIGDLKLNLEEAMEVVLLSSGSTCRWDVNNQDIKIRCNQEALIGALLNLVNNGIQSINDNAHITVRMKNVFVDEKSYLYLQVCDNGPGIDKVLLESLGEIFVTTKAQGTGLGLAVVKAVARAHKGQFHLTSKKGKGTQATFIMPVSQ